MKQKIDAFEYAGQICKAYSRGILLTTKVGDKVNSMTIGWGTMGVEWGRPVFVAYVRESRYTRQLLDQSGEFTINVPMGEVDSKILSICGTRSGRDLDKIEALQLHLEEGQAIATPGIRELPLTLECKVLYRNKQSVDTIPQEIQDRYYPKNAAGEQDFHYAYYAQIVNAYLITE